MTFDQETDFKKAAISIWSSKDPTAEAELTWQTFALLVSHCSVAATEVLETCTYSLYNCQKKKKNYKKQLFSLSDSIGQ